MGEALFDEGPHIHSDTIRKWLNDGWEVRSAAVGRWGQVTSVDDAGLIKIKLPRRGYGVTTFMRGDPVMAYANNNQIVIRNPPFNSGAA